MRNAVDTVESPTWTFPPMTTVSYSCNGHFWKREPELNSSKTFPLLRKIIHKKSYCTEKTRRSIHLSNITQHSPCHERSFTRNLTVLRKLVAQSTYQILLNFFIDQAFNASLTPNSWWIFGEAQTDQMLKLWSRYPHAGIQREPALF